MWRTSVRKTVNGALSLLFSLTLKTYEADRDSSTTAKNVDTPPWITATPMSDTDCETEKERGTDNTRGVQHHSSVGHGIEVNQREYRDSCQSSWERTRACLCHES